MGQEGAQGRVQTALTMARGWEDSVCRLWNRGREDWQGQALEDGPWGNACHVFQIPRAGSVSGGPETRKKTATLMQTTSR